MPTRYISGLAWRCYRSFTTGQRSLRRTTANEYDAWTLGGLTFETSQHPGPGRGPLRLSRLCAERWRAGRGTGRRLHAQHLPVSEAEKLEPAGATQRTRHPGRNPDLRLVAHGQRSVRLRA